MKFFLSAQECFVSFAHLLRWHACGLEMMMGGDRHRTQSDRGKAEIRFLRGRLKFEIGGVPVTDKDGRPQAAPFPSMVCIFGGGENNGRE